MTHRPWPIVIIALFHIFAPVFNFLISARLLEKSNSEFFNFQIRNGYQDLLIWAIPCLAGFALLTFRMWSYYLFLAFMFLASLFTLQQRLLYPHRIDIFLFLFLELINFVVIIYFLSPTVKRIYLNKRIRWWQHSPRFLIQIEGQAHIKFKQENLPPLTISAKILNLSQGGSYIQTTEALNAHDNITLKFSLSKSNYEFPSQIIHAQKDGYGVLFNDSVKTRLEAKKLVKVLKSQKIPIRGQELSTLDSFKFWFNDLLKTGHGLFPK